MTNKSLSFLILFQLFVVFVSAQDSTKVTKKGYISKDKIFELVYVPFDVPEGTTEIRVKETYDQMKVNVLNMGVYDDKGYQGIAGFRG